MALLYADEDFPGPAAKKLRDLGHDVLTAREDGRADQQIADDQVLARATQLGRAVLTHNRSHYQRLHRTDPNHAGIVSCTRDNDFDALAGRIDAAISPLDSLDGRLIKIVRPNRPPQP